MASLSDSSSELSSAPSEDEFDDDIKMPPKKGIEKYFTKDSPGAGKLETTPPRPKREPSPAYELTLIDDPAIAQLVMFRNRFASEFPKSVPHFGPQELEVYISQTPPAEGAEHILCGLLGLLLNRKQDIKVGHYARALEEAISNHRGDAKTKGDWPQKWQQRNPLSGGASFISMTPEQRLDLLHTLLLWTLASSTNIKNVIQNAYKGVRKTNDLNISVSVQAWGTDGEKRRYWLIEGQNDTNFRIYRESNYTGINRGWRSSVGSIDEAKALAQRLGQVDGGAKAMDMKRKIDAAIERFEMSAQKRQRREYKQLLKQRYKQQEPLGVYETRRTRGNRKKYTYSDDDEEESSATTASRRATRTSNIKPPINDQMFTSSGRQVKSRNGGTYDESFLSGAPSPALSAAFEGGDSEANSSRSRRAASRGVYDYLARGGKHIEGYNSVDELDDEDDASEQDYGDDEEDDELVPLESDDDGAGDLTDVDEDIEDYDDRESLIVKLPIKPPSPNIAVKTKSPSPASIIRLKLSPGKIPQKADHEIVPLDAPLAPVEAKENFQPAPSPKKSNSISETVKINGFVENFSGPPESSYTMEIDAKASTLPPSIDVGYGGS